MKHRLLFLSCLSVILVALAACSKDDGSDTPLYQYDSIEYDANRKILITYFSWGGNTQHLAEEIANMTDGTLFRIETVNPYPTDYNECTEVAREELDNGVRPELSSTVDNLNDYDVVFVGCPVWWHTAPMAVWSFLESSEYDFSDKIIVPFCTYASTYREETLAKIVELTPGSRHLQGFGTTGRNTGGVESWLRTIHIIR
ncbi:MAG: flavodoxin [Paraprevotella clara]|uniref:Flavodoxin n=1 Tax=Paraprevotella clara TaxID=454154 RepID=A0A6N3CC29_9BACT